MTRALVFLMFASVLSAAKVTVLRVPNGGIQPQAAVDPSGVVHLVYFAGEPAHGNLFYVRSRDGGSSFSSPIAVNSHPKSAIATGNVRGARIALGSGGRVHIVWNGSSEAAPRGPGGAAPMLYTRLNEAGTAFEPQRNLIQTAYGLDGGGSLAADSIGHVWVLWPAPLPGAEGEENRRVWVARSSDDGKTFERERLALDKPTGACACCSLEAFAGGKGSLYALFRSASQIVHRDMYLLSSTDHGQTFEGTDISPWNVGYCVMSTEAFSEGTAGVVAAWETERQILFARIDPATRKLSPPVSAPGPGGTRKHPAVAANARGETLLAWTEGTGWNKGGSLAWQVFDRQQEPEQESGKAPGVPVWSLITAFTRTDGSFAIVY